MKAKNTKSESIKFSINSGVLKRTNLVLPSTLKTRPTKSILKQSCFNSLRENLSDSIFVECFGGSGSMGLEAISNGAKKAVFFESDATTFCALKQNIESIKNALEKLKIEREIDVHFGDFFALYPSVFSALNAPSILYFDPPFPIRKNMENIYNDCFGVVKNLNNKHIFLVIFEHMSSIEIPKILGNFALTKTKKFGKSALSFLES